jgi:hypothetical protein
MVLRWAYDKELPCYTKQEGKWVPHDKLVYSGSSKV